MDHRLYFVLGDLLSNIVVGAVVGLFTSFIVGPAWDMWLAMILMMIVGSVLALVLWLPLGIFFGAMEVMIPAMLSGMLSGMVVGMWSGMVPLGSGAAMTIGAVCGLVGIVVIWILNNSLRGIADEGVRQ